MQIEKLIASADVLERRGESSREVLSLTYDSRTVTEQSCFFAVPGTVVDGHAFITAAEKAGASLIVCEHMPEQQREDVVYIRVEDTNRAMAQIAAAFYGYPSRSIRVVGVTGTNGKTTIATLLFNLVRMLGYKAGLISTVVYRIEDTELTSTHTTPDSIRLNMMLSQMVDRGCEFCFMECSSHAIVQDRIYGIEFEGALFTNLTHDHLDYHKTFAEYVKAKKRFFDNLSAGAFALVNADDRNGLVMLQNTKARRYTLSLRSMADFRCKIIEMGFDGMLLRLDAREVWVRLLGRFNASNLLTVYGAAMLLGLDQEQVLTAMSVLESVSGRFEFVKAKDHTTAIVDYAHTPDALKNVIQTIDEIRQKSQRLIVVCGCGGDRDKTKRPEMAAIAASNADIAIFTSDNPRTEDPQLILDQMEQGVPSGTRYVKILDRRDAIRTAVMLAQPGDIILIAGKGHENYQIIGTQKLHFDDKECVSGFFTEFQR